MNWKIELYKKEDGKVPVKDFLRKLPTEHRAKAEKSINILQEFGTNLREPYAKPIKGEKYKGLWELRIKFSSDISRIFYFMPVGEKFVLLHGFVKKSQETPKTQLEKAERYMNDYKRRCE
ncbi:MAG: type II toxin-antitoxin system RelE/ParE family toxin [Flavobacterium sp.]|nr:type II toxin-antitoxin system RelE/ParE family toxin [Flavobacterium sp.]